MTDAGSTVDWLELSVEIAAAYVSNNPLPASELPELLAGVHSALARAGAAPAERAPPAPRPAVSARRSVTDAYIVCLEDGKRFKSLKRHLRTQYGMSPEEYRARWGLGPDYPMVAPAYARARSLLAKEMGLGQQRRRS